MLVTKQALDPLSAYALYHKPIKNVLSKGALIRKIAYESRFRVSFQLQSRDLWDKVPIDRLIIAWPGLHTVDEDMAAEIIINDFHLNNNNH